MFLYIVNFLDLSKTMALDNVVQLVATSPHILKICRFHFSVRVLVGGNQPKFFLTLMFISLSLPLSCLSFSAPHFKSISISLGEDIKTIIVYIKMTIPKLYSLESYKFYCHSQNLSHLNPGTIAF